MTAAETHAAMTNQAAVYGRPSADRIAELIEAVDALAAALQTLCTQPAPDGAERVANQLHGMHRSACLLVDTLARESNGWRPATAVERQHAHAAGMELHPDGVLYAQGVAK